MFCGWCWFKDGDGPSRLRPGVRGQRVPAGAGAAAVPAAGHGARQPVGPGAHARLLQRHHPHAADQHKVHKCTFLNCVCVRVKGPLFYHQMWVWLAITHRFNVVMWLKLCPPRSAYPPLPSGPYQLAGLSVHHTSGWTLPLVMSLCHNKMYNSSHMTLFKLPVMAKHSHTWW